MNAIPFNDGPKTCPQCETMLDEDQTCGIGCLDGFDTFLRTLSRPTPAVLWLSRVADQMDREKLSEPRERGAGDCPSVYS